MYHFKVSKFTELLKINEIIKHAKRRLKSNHIDQWQNGTPNLKMLFLDILRGESYVLKNKARVLATAMVSNREEETYRAIEGQWSSNTPYTVIHRFAIADDYYGKGVGTIMIKSIEEVCENKYLRIDTHTDNLPMRRLLEKNGFIFCGVILLKDGSKRNAYDKILR